MIASEEKGGYIMKCNVTSEYERLRTVIVHEPGNEIERLTPSNIKQLLFDDVPYLDEMKREHKKFVEVLKNAGGQTKYFSPAYATARSGKTARASLVACSKNVSGIDTELEIERLESESGEIKVNLKESGGLPSPPLRVTLTENSRELTSYMASEGCAVFEKVPVGVYNINLSRKGISLGAITLEMKGE